MVWLRSLPTRSAGLVFFSPPYEDQRRYQSRFKLRGQAWVDWLRPFIVESARVSNGLVIVNVSSPVRNRSYSPTPEWLVTDLTRIDGLVCGPAPWAWHKVCGIPGSGSTHYQRRDWEPLYSFCLPDRLPLRYADNTAYGTTPKCAPGGAFSNRTVAGGRVNDPWKTAKRGGGVGGRHTNGVKKCGAGGRRANGTKKSIRQPSGRMEVMAYSPPKTANPGNLIRARVGGGHMGHPLAHKSVAPMALIVAERFVHWYADPALPVVDPFCGSGTTGHAAVMNGRTFWGCDEDAAQVAIATLRLKTVVPNFC